MRAFTLGGEFMLELMCENDADRGRDIEKPARQQTVHSFQAQARPITNEEVSIPSVQTSVFRCMTDQKKVREIFVPHKEQ